MWKFVAYFYDQVQTPFRRVDNNLKVYSYKVSIVLIID